MSSRPGQATLPPPLLPALPAALSHRPSPAHPRHFLLLRPGALAIALQRSHAPPTSSSSPSPTASPTAAPPPLHQALASSPAVALADGAASAVIAHGAPQPRLSHAVERGGTAGPEADEETATGTEECECDSSTSCTNTYRAAPLCWTRRRPAGGGRPEHRAHEQPLRFHTRTVHRTDVSIHGTGRAESSAVHHATCRGRPQQ